MNRLHRHRQLDGKVGVQGITFSPPTERVAVSYKIEAKAPDEVDVIEPRGEHVLEVLPNRRVKLLKPP